MKINCYGTFDSTGYGRSGHEFIYLLSKEGFDIRISDPLSEWKGNKIPNSKIKDEILSLEGTFKRPDLIYNCTTPNNWIIFDKAKCIGEFFFECDLIPKEFMQGLSKSDLVFIPSEFVLNTAWNSGIELGHLFKVPPIMIDWKQEQKLESSFFGNDELIYLLIGEFNERKNLFKAIQKIDSTSISGKFIVKTFFKDFKIESHDLYNSIYLSRMLRRLNIRNKDRFSFLSTHLDSLKLDSLFYTCDCLIIPSKGEGFCRPFYEAGYRGTPSIISDIPPMNEEIDSSMAFPIQCSGMEGAFIGNLFAYNLFYNNRGFKWFSIDLDSMIQQIRLINSNKELVKERGDRFREFVKENLDSQKILKERIKKMEELFNESN